jgi:DNA helicase-2/ATP-dependent DNA helicase PcrA
MDEIHLTNPAEEAAQAALSEIFSCIEKNESFLLEAGAGAGKTYSLIEALKHIIEKRGKELQRKCQQVACITYTNVACDEIKSRIDNHPVALAATIHAFCWSLIKDFQPFLRKALRTSDRWAERQKEKGEILQHEIRYDFGYPSIVETHVTISHDDVLSLTVKMLELEKFRKILIARYPILFIDEYQDTNAELANALKIHLLAETYRPLIGFFGDHWQKIYREGIGKIEHPSLRIIGKGANFRSAKPIVDVLNRMRTDLPQAVKDMNSTGYVAVYHTNSWTGTRHSGGQWAGDLPSEVAHDYLASLRDVLGNNGWDFFGNKTKILMLTHKVLAQEQQYSGIESVFDRREAFTQKEDPHIEFFVDILEPACIAFENRQYGNMFVALDGRIPSLNSRSEKRDWANDMTILLELRRNGTIGAVIDHLRLKRRPPLPERAERREKELEQISEDTEPENDSLKRLRKLRKIPYREVVALTQFLNDHTPFSTKHGVKGAEFENVLVVIGRGWSMYNFNDMLEWAGEGVAVNKQEAFERNRNLFYVVCSRPKTRLALLFTQKLSAKAISTLESWFGKNVIHSL